METNDYHSEGEMVHDPVTDKIIWIGGTHRKGRKDNPKIRGT